MEDSKQEEDSKENISKEQLNKYSLKGRDICEDMDLNKMEMDSNEESLRSIKISEQSQNENVVNVIESKNELTTKDLDVITEKKEQKIPNENEAKAHFIFNKNISPFKKTNLLTLVSNQSSTIPNTRKEMQDNPIKEEIKDPNFKELKVDNFIFKETKKETIKDQNKENNNNNKNTESFKPSNIKPDVSFSNQKEEIDKKIEKDDFISKLKDKYLSVEKSIENSEIKLPNSLLNSPQFQTNELIFKNLDEKNQNKELSSLKIEQLGKNNSQNYFELELDKYKSNKPSYTLLATELINKNQYRDKLKTYLRSHIANKLPQFEKQKYKESIIFKERMIERNFDFSSDQKEVEKLMESMKRPILSKSTSILPQFHSENFENSMRRSNQQISLMSNLSVNYI